MQILQPTTMHFLEVFQAIITESGEDPLKLLSLSDIRRGKDCGNYTDLQLVSYLTYFAEARYIAKAIPVTDFLATMPEKPASVPEKPAKEDCMEKNGKFYLKPDPKFRADDLFYITSTGIAAYYSWENADGKKPFL